MPGLQAREIALVGLFAALTAVGAIFSIDVPFTQVPFTLQVLFTLLAGAMLGSKLGALSQAVYVLMGVAGLPVFAGRRAGLGVLLGPTGGYLVGFILAAAVVGWVCERRRGATVPFTLLAMGAGLLAIYVPGVLWLGRVLQIGVERAFLLGAAPFILFDLAKAVAAVLLSRALQVRGFGLTGPMAPHDDGIANPSSEHAPGD